VYFVSFVVQALFAVESDNALRKQIPPPMTYDFISNRRRGSRVDPGKIIDLACLSA
jgi:hypothetical protein